MCVCVCVDRLFAGVQPMGQPAVDAINSYQSVVRLLNASLQMALSANQTIAATKSLVSSVSGLEAAVNQSVADSEALQQTVDQLNSSLAASGRWQHARRFDDTQGEVTSQNIWPRSIRSPFCGYNVA